MTPSDIRKEYISNRVAAATPMEMTRMLYEGAVQSVQQAIEAHRAGDILTRGNAVTKAVEILGELRFSLRRDVNPQYCDMLAGLYSYLQRRLIQAHAEKSETMLREVLGLAQTLLEGWVGAMNNVEPVQGEQELKASAAAGSPDASAANPYSPEAGSPQNRSWEF
jgi:flagellar protein FliS